MAHTEIIIVTIQNELNVMLHHKLQKPKENYTVCHLRRETSLNTANQTVYKLQSLSVIFTVASLQLLARNAS